MEEKLHKEELEEFLKSINFDKRLEEKNWFSNEELKQIFSSQLQNYFAGKVSLDFIINLANIFYNEAMTQVKYDESLNGILCDIVSLNSEINEKLSKALKELKRS